MENGIDSILAEATNTAVAEDSTEQVQDFDHTFDLTEEDLADPEENQEGENFEETAEADEGEIAVENPTNNAFAQMRTQNKEYQTRLEEIDSLVKGLGMKDTNDFIQRAKEAQVKKEAQEKGIPLEVAQELEEMRELKNSIIAEREQNAKNQAMDKFMSNVQSFVAENNLSEAVIDKLSQDLEKDGFSVDMLMNMSQSALNKVLGSYVGVNYQKNLERKNAIKKELPIDQSSKIDTESLNKDLDNLAKQLAGKF